MKLEDHLSGNTFSSDRQLYPGKRSGETQKGVFYYEKDEARIVVNPAGDYTIGPDDCRNVVKSMPK